MTRVKRGVSASKRRKNVLKDAKGFRWRRKSTFRAAKEALLKAGKYAHRDRRTKKRTRRAGWIIQINSALRPLEVKYSQFIKILTGKNIEIDRKVLSQMANEDPQVFEAFVNKIK